MEKLNRKIVISIICSIIIFMSFIIFNNKVYAENETSSENTTETIAEEKSSNANLKDFGITPYDFSGFKPDNTSYKVTVPSDAESVEIYAVLQDDNARITETGKKNLEFGDNNFDITVIAEDGTKKIYKINIIRQEGEDEKVEEEQNTESVKQQYAGDGLASLNIENLELSPDFDTVIYEYKAKYIGESTTLDIKTTTTDPYYTVEITGNENLKEGENIVNILVADPDGKNIATYQITVNKSLVDEEEVAKKQEEARKKEQERKFIICVSVIVAILVIVIILIIRHKKNERWAEEYSVPFAGLNEDELPKELKDNKESINELDGYEDELSKEQAREKFLKNYNNNNNYNDYDKSEDIPKRKKHKGKRFK